MISLNEQLAVEPDFNSIILSQKADLMEKDAEIERLKAELELRDKVIEQAIEFGDFRIVHVGAGEHEIKRPDIDNWGKDSDYPELFAHLAGRGE